MRWPARATAAISLILFVPLLSATGAFAQVPIVPTGLDTIPAAEAEQHLIERIPPKYPQIAKMVKVEGEVQLLLKVDANGAVVRIVDAAGPPLLLAAARDAALRYRYKPFERNGKVGEVLVPADIEFRLPTPPEHPVQFPPAVDLKTFSMDYDGGNVNIRVAGDGTVNFNGLQYVAVEGKHQRKIEPEEVQSLVDAFRKADFFSLEDDYSVSATDVYWKSISLQIGDQHKKIAYNVDKPAFLDDVEEAILRYSHSDQWTKGNGDTVRGLVAEAPSVEARLELLSNELPYAAYFSDIDVVREILSYAVDINRAGPYKNTALMLAASRGLPEMVDALLKSGADPHLREEFGRDALTYGAESGNPEVVRLLLAAGLKADSSDAGGDTPLMAGAASGNPEVVRLLLANGAAVNAVNKRRQTALLSAATGDEGFYGGYMDRWRATVPKDSIHRDIVVLLLVQAGADVEARGWKGETALFSIEDDAVRELLRHGPDLEARNEGGETPLIDTVSDSIAALLISAGADVNARDNDGKTALIHAGENNHVDKIKLLVKAPGIELEAKDHEGMTALARARAEGLQDSIAALVAGGATQ